MLVIVKNTCKELSEEAARIVANAIKQKSTTTIGFATGGTQLGMYQELIRLHREEGLDFSRVVTFNLDEYLGLAPDHPQSYHYYMYKNFFDHINISHQNIHIPDGTIRNSYEIYCEEYEKSIQSAGGIDLQVLGIGRNGHIGFNEPTSSLGSRTRVKTLTTETMEQNRRFFQSEDEVPQCVITMGVGTILEAQRILLLASGEKKTRAVTDAIEGPITASRTGSALQLHKDVTVVLDKAAGQRLSNAEYYRRVLETTSKVTPGRLW
jgi:glucosamine-6-phosphate deaminase